MPDPQTAYTTAALNANWLRLLVETLRSQGCEPQDLLEDCGLVTADLLRPQLRVSPSQIDAAIRAALRHMPDRPLGLLLAQRVRLSTYGMLGAAMMAAPTLGEALRLGLRFRRAAGVLVDPVLEERAGCFTLSWTVDCAADTRAFQLESAVASAIVFFRGFLGQAVPRQVSFAYPPPPWAAEYDALFGRPVQFDAPRTCMVAERHWLDLPLPTHDPLTLKQVTAALESFAILDDSERDLVGAVQACLRLNLARAPDLAQLADMLFVSERTLRRRLAERNLSYKRLVDELRRDAALEMLAAHVTMDDVASRVGFADSRTLRRALKRWTGSR